MVAIFSALVNKDAFDDSAEKRRERALVKPADVQVTEASSAKSVSGLLLWKKKKKKKTHLYLF